MQGRAMGPNTPKLQVVLYRVFVVTCTTASALGLLVIWGVALTEFLVRLLGTCVVVAVACAFTLSTKRLVAGRPPEDDVG